MIVGHSVALVLVVLVAAVADAREAPPPPCLATGNCPACDEITNKTECLKGTHPFVSTNKTKQRQQPHCVWDSVWGTSGCSNCTRELGMAMAKAWCADICPPSGPNPVLRNIQPIKQELEPRFTQC